jgi:hypothetical protein
MASRMALGNQKVIVGKKSCFRIASLSRGQKISWFNEHKKLGQNEEETLATGMSR